MKPFQVEWPEAQVADVLKRVREYRFPELAPAGWALGCDPEFLKRVQAYWVDSFDWRQAVSALNRFPQFIAQIDGTDLHFVHIVGEASGKRPLLITHGWPGSHYEFWNVIERLAYPSRFGGDAKDAFDLVIPSLPGFGFSGRPVKSISQRQTAALWNSLMTEVLHYPKYAAQGGDFGAIVTSWLGLDHRANVSAIHLNMMYFRSADPPVDEAERAWLGKSAGAQHKFGAYAALHMSKPHSIILATAGNPLGQAAWILERFHDWSDLGERGVEDVYGLDHLLTNVMIYVMTDSFSSAIFFYLGVMADGGPVLASGTRCETPTAYANFPGDSLLPPPPRSRVEAIYNLTRWTDLPRGGHFAAMEQPELFAEDVRDWGRSISF